jgi:hypothetical protein
MQAARLNANSAAPRREGKTKEESKPKKGAQTQTHLERAWRAANVDLEHRRARLRLGKWDVHALLEAAADGRVELPRSVGRACEQAAPGRSSGTIRRSKASNNKHSTTSKQQGQANARTDDEQALVALAHALHLHQELRLDAPRRLVLALAARAVFARCKRRKRV